MKLLKFILTGFIFAQIIEFEFNVYIAKTYGNWIFTLFYYPIILAGFYLVSKLINRKIKNKKTADIIYYLISGFFGLIVMEWLIIGNSPWGNPQASQLGMLSFWVAVFFMPRIFIDPNPQIIKLKKQIATYIIIYSLITLPLGLISSATAKLILVVYAEIIGYTILHLFYYRYFKIKT